MRDRSLRPGHVPFPLAAGFGLFVVVLGYLVTASLARRDAPVFVPTPATHARPRDWTRVGDTLTLDATDGDRWRYASLSTGRALGTTPVAGWEIAARRYRVTVNGALADLGPEPFERARPRPDAAFVPSARGETANRAIDHWYRYSLVTHLLVPNGHVYALRTAGGALWKLQVLGYYCPRLVAGCLTIRYAPLPR
jgi:hypothetical protein